MRSKLPHIGTTIFTVMTNRARELGAINLAQGFPDFPMPEPMQLKGIDDYRALWEAYFGWFENKQVFGLNELTVTAGSLC